MPCDFRLDYGRAISRRATLIGVNRSRRDLKLNRAPKLAVRADPGQFLIELAGSTAVSKVTFDYSGYTDSVWHHGQPITLADAVYSIAQTFDLAYDEEKAKIETALAVIEGPVSVDALVECLAVKADARLLTNATFALAEIKSVRKAAGCSAAGLSGWESVESLIFALFLSPRARPRGLPRPRLSSPGARCPRTRCRAGRCARWCGW